MLLTVALTGVLVSFNSLELMLLLLLSALVKILAKVPLMVYLSNNLLLGAALEYMFVSLTVFMVFMTMVTMSKAKAQESIMMFILFVLMLLFFYETKLIMFYMWYELSLLPMFLIIMFYGYQPERLTASMSLMFYTLMASSPLLVVLLILSQTLNTENFALWSLKSLHMNMNTLMCFTMCLSFLVKLPMYPFHLWLPKAHVEAPVYGSMILAAVMLKMGSFGLIRIWEGSNSQMLGKILFAVSLVSAFHISRYNLAELDMKVVIAYSSVAHMAVLLTAFLSMYSWGIFSMLFTSVAHGVSSSLLFYGAFLIYLRSHSRSLVLNKGSNLSDPVFMVFWFLAILACAGAPLNLNFISEIFSILASVSFMSLSSLAIFLNVMLTMSYSAVLYTVVSHGGKQKTAKLEPLSLYEVTGLVSHCYYLVMTVFLMNLI